MKNLKSIKLLIGENNKLTKTISILFLCLLMFGLFTFILTGLYWFDLLPEFPEFIQNIFFKTDDGGIETDKDDGNIYDFLQHGDNKNDFENFGSDQGFTLEITLDNIKDVISRTKLPDNLHLETKADYYTDGIISRTEEMLLWKKGGRYRYTLTVNSVPEELYINDSRNEFIENFATKSTLRRTAPEAFSFDNIPHVTNINYYLDLLERVESGEITRVFAHRNNDSNIVEIRYSIPLLDQHKLIYISLDTGIVEWVRIFTGEHYDLFYESTTMVREAYYDGDVHSAERTLINDSLFYIR